MVPPPLPGGLGDGGQGQALGLSRLRPLAQDGVGGGDHRLDLQPQAGDGEILGDALRGEDGAVGGQAVAPVGDGGDGVAALPQLADGLPDGAAAHLELLGQGLPGEIGSAVGLQSL